ncbi:MAG TPA: nitrile hydratase subunit alpha [Acidimicrobiia bacterium]
MSAGDGHADGSVAARVRRLEVLLEERGVVSGEELDAILDRVLSSASPANGARIIARAWVDDAFRARLLADANAAIEELGFSMSSGPRPQLLRVVENTEAVHNLVVCTLCSCYPLSLLGPSPSWYKSTAYRARAVRDPRGVLADFGFTPPDSVDICVWDASAETRFLVLPRRPVGTEGWSEEQLAGLVTRAGMIGTAAV